MSFLWCSCAFKIWFLENIQPSRTPLSLRSVPRDPINLSPKQARVCRVQKPKVAILLSPLLISCALKTNHCTQSGLRTPHHPQVLLCSHNTGPAGSLPLAAHSPAVPGSIFHTLQEPPRLLPLCCFLSVQRHTESTGSHPVANKQPDPKLYAKKLFFSSCSLHPRERP